MTTDYAIAEVASPDLRDYLGALRRRARPIVITSTILLIVAAAVATLLPPVYRSTARILIEEQGIPQELVRSTITSFADERIQVISQRVMTRAVLLNLIEKNNLYVRRREIETNEEILERMRKDIKLTPVNADVADRHSAARINVTIAFDLSYDGETPDAAQRIANALTSLYLNENVKSREERAAETSTFLAEEGARLGGQLADLEARLAVFKRQNAGRLPELAQLNLQLSDRTDSEILRVEREISTLEDRRIYLEGQLNSVVKPNAPLTGGNGERVLDPTERLRVLRSQYASLSGVYSADYPDIKRMRREIAGLEQELGAGESDDTRERATQLARRRAELAALTQKYSPDHPDIARLKKSVAALEDEQTAAAGRAPMPKQNKPDNPQYISFQSQLESSNAELKDLRVQREALKAKLRNYESRLEQTPQVEREYLDLTRDRENTVAKYREIRAKLLEAQVAQELEKDRKGERFSLLEPPQFPEKPFSPNRPAIFLIGTVIALGAGFGYAGVLEVLDSSIRDARGFVRRLTLPLLATIPRIENAADRARERRRRRRFWIIAVAGVLVAALLVHFFVMPLPTLWYVLVRRLMLSRVLL